MLVLLSLPQHSGFMLEPIQNALLALAFLACGGLHKVLRLLSLHLCNEYPSLPKKRRRQTTRRLCLGSSIQRRDNRAVAQAFWAPWLMTTSTNCKARAWSMAFQWQLVNSRSINNMELVSHTYKQSNTGCHFQL